MADGEQKKLVDIRDRAFEFAVRIVKLCKYLETNTDVSRNVISQLLRSGTSVGANLEEARAGQSTADFIHKNAIALKEARESNYWLRLVLATETLRNDIRTGIEELRDEAVVITKIVAKTILTAKSK
ncbi:MAG TPA: four helix bundle protein [Pyrinomonadaceae bacterium]|nr:four helix bundle protein [Pyrinomonadaceae bacterium]